MSDRSERPVPVGSQNPAGDDELSLAVVVSAARSGTTLLRSLLDAHPEIGCPAEAGLPSLVAHARQVWETVCTADVAKRTDPLKTDELEGYSTEDVAPLPSQAEDEIRHTALSIMHYYCDRRHKRVYCDKSLDTPAHLGALHRTFPDTKYIIVVRHVMDTVASGIEASPWGFNAFGYTRFVQDTPHNTVLALARYWDLQMTLALRWRELHPDQCHTVRYEDLVREPRSVLLALFGFLQVAGDGGVIKTAFDRFRPTDGPGDYKLVFTHGVSAASVGRGKQVPIELVPESLRERLNPTLEAFGYDALSESWNAEPAASAAAPPGVKSALARIMQGMDSGDWPFEIESIAIVCDDDARSRWVIDAARGTVTQGDGEVELVLTGLAADLVAMFTMQVNLGVLLRSGRVRCVHAQNSSLPSDLPLMMRRLVAQFANDGRIESSAARGRR